MTILLRIAECVLNVPLLVHPDKLPLILAVLEGRIPIAAQHADELREAQARIEELPPAARDIMRGPVPDASRFGGSFVAEDGDGRKTMLPYRRNASGTALLPILGGLANRGMSAEASSMSRASYEAIGYQIEHARADDRTSGVLLDMQTPGGEAVGAFELATAVRRLAAEKPVMAVVNGMAASAGYAIASAANKIVITPSGVAGSIGVVMLHADYSRYLDKAGITPTYIFAGAHKVDGNPMAPLPDSVREHLQSEVNAYYDLFVQTVASGRRQLSPAAIRATEARTFIGADAVTAGLADSVGTFEEALAELTQRGKSGRAQTSRGVTMENKTGAPAADTTGNVTKADHDAAVSTARADGEKAGRAAADTEHKAALGTATAAARVEGATAERERILGIEKIAVAGHETVVAEMKADGKTTPEAAAMRILEAEKATRGKRLDTIKAVETEGSKVPAVAVADPGAAQTAKPKASTPAEWEAEYAADAKLQAEFPDAKSYAAFQKADAAGKVRILKK
jgi:signal peptide peptidase SppA